MELDGYNFLEGENISVYDHMNKHTLATIVQLNENNEEAGHKVAMQVAAMKPVALDEASIPQSVKDEEFKVAVEKTKEEQVEKAVVAAIKKAGINANLVDSDDHIESNIKKGWLTREEADKAIEIRNTVAAEKAANLNEDMIQNIAKGRLNKFFKENCLVDQEFQFGDGDKQSVSEWLKAQSKLIAGVTIISSKLISDSPDAVTALLSHYKDSVAFAVDHPDDAATLVGKYGIVPEPIAKVALPKCNITYIDGADMKSALSSYLGILAEANPQSVGGQVPGDDFYFGA